MEKTHETQSTEELNTVDDDKLYTPIEDWQKITAGGNFKRDSFNLTGFPKGIRFIGYFFIGFSMLSFVIMMILSIFF